MFGKIINIDPEILGGTPVFSGTRVPLKNLFDYFEAGKTIDLFIEDFDTITKRQILHYIENILRKRLNTEFTDVTDIN
jgi:uncharacterized protein (DUF433 family)